jgi:filamentous hemagglutinin
VGRSGSHQGALQNHERAVISEAKVRYALRDRDKRRAFEALGYSEERENWQSLRDAILEGLPCYPAPISHEDQWGITHNVDMPISGPEGKTAPVRTKWIFRVQEDFRRLVTLYVKTTEWRRREREQRS